MTALERRQTIADLALKVRQRVRLYGTAASREGRAMHAIDPLNCEYKLTLDHLRRLSCAEMDFDFKAMNRADQNDKRR